MPSVDREPVEVLIPAFNEGATIARVVKAASRAKPVKKVIVIDDGSVDKTSDHAGKAGAEVLTLQQNEGKAAAVTRGVYHSRAPVLVLLDGDVCTGRSVIEQLVDPVLHGRADLTIGIPDDPGQSSAGFGMVNAFSRWMVHAHTGCALRYPLSGQRAVRRRLLMACLPLAPRYGIEMDLTLKVCAAGAVIREVPIRYQHQGSDRSAQGWMHRARQGLDIARAVTAYWKTNGESKR